MVSGLDQTPKGAEPIVFRKQVREGRTKYQLTSMLTSLTFKSKMHISEMITSLRSASPMYKSVTYIHQFLRQGKYFDKATRKQVIYQLLWVINNLCVGKIIALTDLLTRCWNGILSAWQYSSRRIFSQAWMTKNLVYW